ncbi:hypothetical protein Rhopal_003657-T1 [Rhodotorula paludigena]|uniref:Conidiation-specific protein 10 n=1 Tax=Rhodotorula paludigena TaxID=86838 RepID=A0AAV5GMA4_9BASI|nr:hypothetical protein Rhopal_003657-T1 [Rhodotorula paludigena]
MSDGDARKSSEHGFGGNREFASEMGKKGGATQPDEVYKPSEHGGLKKDGTEDKRMSSQHGFGADHERASEMGKRGGAKNSTDDE